MSHASFTFGRFSPPTIGHQKLVDKVVDHAKEAGGDHYIFASHSQDAKKNPLHHADKIGFMRKFFPHANIANEKDVKTPIDAMKHLHAKGYKKVTMVVGSDRVQEMHNLLHKYNGKEYNFDHIEVKSAGARDPDAEGVEGMSASKMRDAATRKDFNAFREGVPKQEHAKGLYDAVRRGLNLESMQKHFKAIFLVGGPGSGKDILIKSGLQESGLPEISLEKMYKTIVENASIRELESFSSVVINGNADDYSKINVCRKVFEQMGYDTSMIFVYTEDAESKRRNDQRIQKGSKTVSEEVRKAKYICSIKNMHTFSEEFGSFFLYDNSKNYERANQKEREQIVAWTSELFEGVSEFVSIAPSNPSAIKWLVEHGKVNVNAINTLFEEEILNEHSELSEKTVLGRGAETRTANRTAERRGYSFSEAKETKTDSSKKKTRTKPAINPTSQYDGRLGYIPSVTGITVSEKRSFSNFRKK